MTTPLVEMDGDEMTRIIWKRLKSVSIALIIAFSFTFYFSCSSDEYPNDMTIEDFIHCWPKGDYSGKIIECKPYQQPRIEVITAPIAASDSLWPCVGHNIAASCTQKDFHVGDTIVFKMKGSCTRYRTINGFWWAQIELYE